MINMKKGFTLVEMLAAITVLAIIIIISVPAVTSMLKRNDVSKYEEFKKDLFLGAETYIEANRSLYPNISNADATYNISLGVLRDGGYVKNIPAKTPEGVVITDYMYVLVKVNSDLTLSFQFVDH